MAVPIFRELENMGASERMAWEQWVAQRDPGAFNHIIRDYAGMVYTTCLRILRNPADAEDVAQECFEALVQTHDTSRVQAPGPWLHGMATYRSMTRIRSDNRRRQRESEYAEAVPDRVEIQWDDVYDLVDEAIAELPEEYRDPLVLHFLQGQSHAEIGRALGIPRRTVSNHVQRAVELVGVTLRKKGIAIGGALLSGLMSAHLAQAAPIPASLVSSLGKLALAQSAGQVASGLAGNAGAATLGGIFSMKNMIVVVFVVALAGSGWLVGRSYLDTPTATVLSQTSSQESAQSQSQTENSVETSVEKASTALDAPAVQSPSSETVHPPQNLAPDQIQASGRVIDEDGLPVSDVKVGLKPANVYGISTDDAVLPDKEGNFAVSTPAERYGEMRDWKIYFCIAESRPKGGYAREIDPMLCPILDTTTQKAFTDVQVVLPSRKRFVAGIVRNERGEPISDAHLLSHSGTQNAQGWSGKDGRFRLERIYPYHYCFPGNPTPEMIVDNVPVYVSHKNYEEEMLDRIPIGTENLEIVLPDKRRGYIGGKVVDAETGKAIPNAKAWISFVERSPGKKDYYTYKPEDAKAWPTGEFVFWDIKTGTATLYAAASGYGMACKENVIVSTAKGTEDIEIPLQKGGSVVINAKFSEDMIRQRGMIEWLHAFPKDTETPVDFSPAKLNDETYLFALAPGQYTLLVTVSVASDPEHPSDNKFCKTIPVEVAAGQNIDIDAEFGGSGILRGIISTTYAKCTRRIIIRRGETNEPIPDHYIMKRPTIEDMAGYDFLIWASARDQYGLGCLEPGSYTATAMVYSEENEDVQQESKPFTIVNDEIVQLDFAF